MRYDSSIMPQHLNPTLTPELEREVNFFMKWGYLLIEEAITQSQVELLRTALDETFERSRTQFTHQLL